jgi:uncharacterized protein YjbI with pentapeptide repeats
MDYFSEKSYTRSDKNQVVLGQYENCTFEECDFSNENWGNYKFIDCVFSACNLSLIKVSNTSFQSVQFIGCKIMGVLFENVNPFSLELSFKDCNLNHASFYKLTLKNTSFKQCDLHEVDFTESNLTACDFDGADLHLAIFQKTNLEKANFSTSLNFQIDPSLNKVKKAKFSLVGLPGLLSQFDLDIK